nr:DEAD-box ATP-dependent RNA helicase 50 [Ipomoea batatas]
MMLAEAAAVAAAVAPPPYAVNSFKFRRAMVLQPIPLAGSGNVVNLTSCRRKRREVQGSYTRRPMDTPGAYELIDNGTGEKVIVWGGVENDDDDSAIPSKELLSAWKSKSRTGGDVKGVIRVAVASNKTLAGSFSRLKFHKMKALVKKSYTKEQEDDFRDHDEQNARVSATPEVDDFGEQERFDLLDDSSRSDSSDTANENDVRQLHIQNKEMLNDSNNFFSKKSFQDLGCSDYLIESLRKQMFGFPSHIQAMTFERVIEGKSCIISDQSGSGKTLAYLLPLIQRLREEELQGLGKPLSQNPRVIVLTPTAELASQVLNVCRSFSKSGVPFRSVVATGGFRQRTQLENLRQELDVLIATPGRFMFLVKEGHLHLTNLNCAVLDEVDILFKDEDFETALQCLVTSSPVTAQFLFVTATLPVDIYNKLVESFPDCELITGPGMHRTSTGLEEVLVDCSGEEGSEKTPDTAFLNKKNALLQLVEESPVPKTIVFCNKIESCRKVENALKRFDRKGIYVRVLPFHAALDREMRLASMKEFHSPQPKNVSMFLVCTDRASRGIDFTGVDHVVLFDFPRDPSEYVRRVGRTARGAGGKGKAFIFVVGKQVSLAQRIIERNKKGHPLHDVPYT